MSLHSRVLRYQVSLLHREPKATCFSLLVGIPIFLSTTALRQIVLSQHASALEEQDVLCGHLAAAAACCCCFFEAPLLVARLRAVVGLMCCGLAPADVKPVYCPMPGFCLMLYMHERW